MHYLVMQRNQHVISQKKSPYNFQNSCVIETGLSDFHRAAVSGMKTTYEKLKI